jgi:D-alanyl-D-alanine-carboxypeptidase/D-alanyl-D-alanine-endopeptidase
MSLNRRRGRLTFTVVVLGFLALWCTRALEAQSNAPRPVAAASAFPDHDALLAMIASRVAEKRAIGIVLGVMDSDGSTRIVSYGNAGPQAAPLGPGTIFEIGSLTKVFTATVLATMAARQEVSLDAPASNYLPRDLSLPRRDGIAITLANLAEQNSGLPGQPGNFSPKELANPFADYTTSDLAAYLEGLTLPRGPGQLYEYSNLGLGLLGMALSHHSGLSYEQLVTARVLEPLGMSSTGIRLTPQMTERRAVGHDQQGIPVRDWDFSAPFEASGALRSSMIDMMKFLDANMGAASNGLERAMRLAHVPRAAAGNGRIGLNWLSFKTSGGVDIVYHTGNTGGYSSYIGFDPVRGVGVVMLANQFGVTLDIPVHLLDPTIPLRAAPRTPEQLGAIELPAASLTPLIGTYVLDAPPRLRMSVTVENGQLMVEAAGVGKLPFYPRTPSTFFTTLMNAEITFVNDATGAVSRVVVKLNGVDQPGTRTD